MLYFVLVGCRLSYFVPLRGGRSIEVLGRSALESRVGVPGLSIVHIKSVQVVPRCLLDTPPNALPPEQEASPHFSPSPRPKYCRSLNVKLWLSLWLTSMVL